MDLEFSRHGRMYNNYGWDLGVGWLHLGLLAGLEIPRAGTSVIPWAKEGGVVITFATSILRIILEG